MSCNVKFKNHIFTQEEFNAVMPHQMTEAQIRAYANYRSRAKGLPTNDRIPDASSLTDMLDNKAWGVVTPTVVEGVSLDADSASKVTKRAAEWFERNGLQTMPVSTMYGQAHRGMLVENMTTQQAIEFAIEFNQESVMTDKGVVYRDGTMHPRKPGSNIGMAGDMTTAIKVGSTVVPFQVDYKTERVNADGAVVFPNGMSQTGKERYQIVGENANLAENVRQNLNLANNLEAKGKNPREIYMATGWERGADNLWRYSVPPLKLDMDKFKALEESPLFGDKKEYLITDIVSLDDPIFKMYPQLKEIKIVKKPFLFDVFQQTQAAFDMADNSIQIAPYASSPLTTIIHEVQHAIQKIEGFYKGANVQMGDIITEEVIELEGPSALVKAFSDLDPLIDFEYALVNFIISDERFKALTQSIYDEAFEFMEANYRGYINERANSMFPDRPRVKSPFKYGDPLDRHIGPAINNSDDYYVIAAKLPNIRSLVESLEQEFKDSNPDLDQYKKRKTAVDFFNVQFDSYIKTYDDLSKELLEIFDKRFDEKKKEVEILTDPSHPEYKDFLMKRLSNEVRFNLYSRVSGEVEARNAEMRAFLTEAQLIETPISATESYLREAQISPEGRRVANYNTTSLEEFTKSILSNEVSLATFVYDYYPNLIEFLLFNSDLEILPSLPKELSEAKVNKFSAASFVANLYFRTPDDEKWESLFSSIENHYNNQVKGKYAPKFQEVTEKEVPKVANELRNSKLVTNAESFEATFGVPMISFNTALDYVAVELETGSPLEGTVDKAVAVLGGKKTSDVWDSASFLSVVNDAVNNVKAPKTTDGTKFQLAASSPLSKESEDVVKNLVEQLVDRIGNVYVSYRNDPDAQIVGLRSGNSVSINLAKVTLDTPIHEIIGHPMISSIKESNPDLYNNLITELDSGYGKEVFDRVKRIYKFGGLQGEFILRSNQPDVDYGFNLDDTDYFYTTSDDGVKSFYKWTDPYSGKVSITEQEFDVADQELAALGDKLGLTVDTAYIQEEAIVQLLGEYAANKIKGVKKNKNLISKLRELLSEMTSLIREVYKGKVIEVEKLSPTMTVNDLANLIAYTDKKFVLPGGSASFSFGTNETFATYEEAVAYMDKMYNAIQDYDSLDVSSIQLDNDFDPELVPDSFSTSENDSYYKSDGKYYFNNLRNGVTAEISSADYNKVYKDFLNYEYEPGKVSVAKFIDDNYKHERVREAIEKWKEKNNIVYDPNEAYIRGKEFVHVHNLFGGADSEVWLQNLLNNLGDARAAKGKMELSFLTSDPGELPSSILDHNDPTKLVKLVAYPKPKDIAFGASYDIYTSTFGKKSDMKYFVDLSRSTSREQIAATYTKSIPLKMVDGIVPTVADAIENEKNYNEFAIDISSGNFRLEYGDNVKPSVKKLVNLVNSKLEQKYGKLEKPSPDITTKPYPEQEYIGDKSSVISKIYEDLGFTDFIEGVSEAEIVDYLSKGYVIRDDDYYEEGKVYTVAKPTEVKMEKQALINTRLAILKQLPKKYYRGMITSSVANPSYNERKHQLEGQTPVKTTDVDAPPIDAGVPNMGLLLSDLDGNMKYVEGTPVSYPVVKGDYVVVKEYPYGKAPMPTQQPQQDLDTPQQEMTNVEAIQQMYEELTESGEDIELRNAARNFLDSNTKFQETEINQPEKLNRVRIDKASDDLAKLFKKDNIPLTVEEAVEIVKQLESWKDWYEGMSELIVNEFQEYSADAMLLIYGSAVNSDSASTVGMGLNNLARLYNNEPIKGFAQVRINYYEYLLKGSVPSSPKIDPFIKASLGDPNAIAVDQHVWTLMNSLTTKANPSTKNDDFDVAKKFVTNVAEALGWEPRQVQAAMWAANILRMGGKPETYETFILKRLDEDYRETLQSWREQGIKPMLRTVEKDGRFFLEHTDPARKAEFEEKLIQAINDKKEEDARRARTRAANRAAKMAAETVEKKAVKKAAKTPTEKYSMSSSPYDGPIPMEVYDAVQNQVATTIQDIIGSRSTPIATFKGQQWADQLGKAIARQYARFPTYGAFRRKNVFYGSPEYLDRVGTDIKYGFDVKTLAGKIVHAIWPDQMLVGDIEGIVQGKGGLFYTLTSGRIWAFGERGNASTQFVNAINAIIQADIDNGGPGEAYIMVGKGALGKTTSSSTGLDAFVRVFMSYADLGIVDRRVLESSISKLTGIKLPEDATLDDFKAAILTLDFSTFEKRGGVTGGIAKALLDEIKANPGSLNEQAFIDATLADDYNATNPRDTSEVYTKKFSKGEKPSVLKDITARLMTEDLTLEAKQGDVYAFIKVNGFVKSGKAPGHESYGTVVYYVDKTKRTEVLILDNPIHAADMANDKDGTPVQNEKRTGHTELGATSKGQKTVRMKELEDMIDPAFFTSSKDEVYGFAQEGRIILNGDKVNSKTLLEQAGHLWLDWARDNRSDLFEEGLKKVEDTPYLEQAKQSKFHQERVRRMPLEDRETYFRKQALANAIGDNGESIVNKAKKKDIKDWLSSLWSSVAELFGIRDKTADQVRQMTLGEFSSMVAADILSPRGLGGGVVPSTPADMTDVSPDDKAGMAAIDPNATQKFQEIPPQEVNREVLVMMADGSTKYLMGTPNQFPQIPEGAQVIKEFPNGRPVYEEESKEKYSRTASPNQNPLTYDTELMDAIEKSIGSPFSTKATELLNKLRSENVVKKDCK
jgi:hypothetical protein